MFDTWPVVSMSLSIFQSVVYKFLNLSQADKDNITAAMPLNEIEWEVHSMTAFTCFDKDRSGNIIIPIISRTSWVGHYISCTAAEVKNPVVCRQSRC